MITVSNDFKSDIIQPKQNGAKIVVGGNTIPIDNLNSIRRSWNSTLFKTICKYVDIDSNVSIAKDTTIQPYYGVYLENDFEYVSLGTYKTKDAPILNKDTNSYQIIAYDKIVESMIPYALTNSDITYPCSVRDLFVAIFTKLNWNTSGIPATFTNSTSSIEEDVYSNMDMTYRDVLDELCTISCMFLIDNGNPTLKAKTTTSETINEEFMSDTNVKIGNQVFYNSLVFSRASESDNIYRKDDTSINYYGLHEFKVKDLQILSLNWRDNFIDEMWNYIKTFTYYAFEINTGGITYLEPIDGFTLSIFGSTYSTILLNSDLTLCNGLYEKIYSTEAEETETEYKYADTTDKKINQTTLTVDKQNKEIIARISTNEEQITNLQLTTDSIQSNVTTSVDNLSNQINILQTSTSLQINAINQTLEDGVEKVNNSLVTIDINGIKTSRTDETFNTQITNKTFEVKDSNKELAFIGYDANEQKTVARIPELEAKQITAGVHRCETIERNNKQRTAWFYVGGGN